MEKCLRALLAGAALLFAVPASASVIVLDFEGIGNVSPVVDFYNGGGRTIYGIELSQAAPAVVDEDAGGAGNMANEPSPDVVMSFQDGNDSILNVQAGFDTGFSFFDTASSAALVDDGPFATDNLLGTLSLVEELGDTCTGAPEGGFCDRAPAAVALEGIEKLSDVGGPPDRTALDEITPGGAGAVGASVAEPAILALLGAGLVLAGVLPWRSRRSAHALRVRRKKMAFDRYGGSGRRVVRGVR